ncbi:odorant receptor coreceptor-like [Prorops nasuta]|uniref:odorant receptor coreceptor-like n=1 Tax=Prorops nasuta TaxID=863751 RepID=UPI0034CDA1AD
MIIERNEVKNINCNAIIICIQQHQRLLKFLNDYETLYSPALLLGLVICIISLSCSLYTTSNFSGESNFQSFFQIGLILIFQLLFNSLGQIITNFGIDLPNKVYCIDWYYLHPQAQKLLVLILRQCLIPCKLTAFKFFTLSLDLYRAMTQTAISYCMLFYYL